MSVQDVIAILIVAVAVVYTARTIWRTLQAGCSSGCGKCGTTASRSGSTGEPVVRPDRIVRKPMVTQVGLPKSSRLTGR